MCRPGSEARVFARGAREEPWEPLRSFLLPLPVEVVEEFAPVWCGEPGAPILIPFSQSAAALRAASRCGRVVASDPNPLTALLQGLQVQPPPPQTARRALRALGDRLVKGARLGEVLLRLYETPCPSCGRPLVAEAFLWDRELRRPVQRKIRCAPCGLEGWVRTVPQDAARFAEPEKKGFHYWRVLDLLARRGDALYPAAREFLDLYTPRNLQALDLLATEAASAFARDEDRLLRDVAWAMLIGCLDLCSSLHPAEGLPMPRRLRPARRFLERNVWLVLEEMAAYWEGLAQAGEGRGWGVHLRCGSVGEAFSSLQRGGAPLAILSPPPPHPTFWHLTYFWTCWLWGREAAEKVRPLLHLAGPSWTWYVQALTRALRVVAAYLAETAPLVLWLRQDRSLAEAVLLAAASAGFVPVTGAVQFREIAPLSSGGAEVLALFRRAAAPARGQTDLPQAAREAARDLLARLQEPASFAQLWGAFYWRLLEEGALPDLFASKGALVEMLRGLEGPLREELAALVRAGEAEALGSWEQGRLGLPEEGEAARPFQFWRRKRPWEEEFPLTDRVESAVWSALLGRPGQRAADLCREVYSGLGGLCTPPVGWVEECLRSYGQEGEGGRWALRPEDRPERRWQEFLDLLADLRALGQALGFRVVENQAHLGRCRTVWGEVPSPVAAEEAGAALLPLPFVVGWVDEGRLQYAFALSWTSSVAPVAVGSAAGPAGVRRCLVIPGGRASLLAYRKARAPWLSSLLEQGNWYFIKYRHLRQLAAEPEAVSRARLEQSFGLDPIVERSDAQMALF